MIMFDWTISSFNLEVILVQKYVIYQGLVVTMAISIINGSKINFYETLIDVHCTVSRISSSSSSLLFPLWIGEISFPVPS
jgi:hypothetical protein